MASIRTGVEVSHPPTTCALQRRIGVVAAFVFGFAPGICCFIFFLVLSGGSFSFPAFLSDGFSRCRSHGVPFSFGYIHSHLSSDGNTSRHLNLAFSSAGRSKPHAGNAYARAEIHGAMCRMVLRKGPFEKALCAVPHMAWPIH